MADWLWVSLKANAKAETWRGIGKGETWWEYARVIRTVRWLRERQKVDW
jgi:hypothetical protein